MVNCFIELSLALYLVGKDNCECLCQTCEDAGTGGFAPRQNSDSEQGNSSEIDGEAYPRRAVEGTDESDAMDEEEENVTSENKDSPRHRRHRRARVRVNTPCGSRL